MRKVIGWTILASPLVALFIGVTVFAGFWVAVAIYAITAFLVGLICFGAHLAVD